MTGQRPTKVAREQPEAQLQRAVLDHVRLRRAPGWLVWSTPNAAKRSAWLGAELKRQGLTPGVGDLSLIHQGRYYELELKTVSGRLSPAQRERQFAVQQAGGTFEVAFGIDDAIGVLRSWGTIK